MLSASVANALTLEGGEEASETSRFVALMDCFFDALNVGSFDIGYKERRNLSFFRLSFFDALNVGSFDIGYKERRSLSFHTEVLTIGVLM